MFVNFNVFRNLSSSISHTLIVTKIARDNEILILGLFFTENAPLQNVQKKRTFRILFQKNCFDGISLSYNV